MVIWPGCKINLGLQVLRKRPDGYHDLATCFYPVTGLSDAVEVVPSSTSATQLFQYGNYTIEGPQEKNLCYKAWALLHEQYKIPHVDIHLLKSVPFGAGLGGGSADAVGVLLACNKLFDLNLGQHRLEELALMLGSDCPFFVAPQPKLATGRGEVFEPISINLSGYDLVMVHPGFGVSTAQAFAAMQPNDQVTPLAEILQQPVENWAELGLRNDFEATVFPQCGVLAEIKAIYAANHAAYSAMSGSGSTMFALFKTDSYDQQKLLDQLPYPFVRILNL